MQGVFKRIKDILTTKSSQALYCKIEESSDLDRHYFYGLEYGYKKSLDIVESEVKRYNNGWISCTERLPEMELNRSTSETVLVTTYGIVCLAFMLDNGAWYDLPFGDRIHPVAWQPLPQPYKEK